MSDFPRKNCLIGGSMALFSAVCFTGAAGYFARSSQSGLMTLYLSLAAGQLSFGIFLLKRSKQSK